MKRHYGPRVPGTPPTGLLSGTPRVDQAKLATAILALLEQTGPIEKWRLHETLHAETPALYDFQVYHALSALREQGQIVRIGPTRHALWALPGQPRRELVVLPPPVRTACGFSNKPVAPDYSWWTDPEVQKDREKFDSVALVAWERMRQLATKGRGVDGSAREDYR